MSSAGSAWPSAPVSGSLPLEVVSSAAARATLRATMKARSVFVRRELRHLVTHSSPDARLSILVLGGFGREALELADDLGGSMDVEIVVVSEECDPALLAESLVRPLEGAVRLAIRQQPPLDFLLADDATAVRSRDLVIVDSLLDRVDDATAVRVLQAGMARLSRGGNLLGATLDDGFSEADLAALGEANDGAWRTRDFHRIADILASLDDEHCHARVLERGPNRWISLRREYGVSHRV